MDTSTKVNWLKLLQYTVLLGIVLYVGRSVFVPLSFALLISFVLYPICSWLEEKKNATLGRDCCLSLDVTYTFRGDYLAAC